MKVSHTAYCGLTIFELKERYKKKKIEKLLKESGIAKIVLPKGDG